jgi:predicted peptidase
MLDALKAAKVQEVKYTVYPEAQHDSWTATYSNPELYDWFLQHERAAGGKRK